MNFFSKFFESLVEARKEEFVKKNKINLEEVAVENKKEEKEKRREILFVRHFPIEKIAAKELAPTPTSLLKVNKIIEAIKREKITEEGIKGEMQESVIENLQPSIEIKEQIESKQIENKEEFDWGKLNEFVNLPNLDSLQCSEGDKITISYTNGKIETKDVSLTHEELLELLKRLSNKTKIPISPETALYFGDFFIQAQVKEKITLLLKKIL